MSQFDTQKLYNLLDTLTPKKNYLLLHDPEQNPILKSYWNDHMEAKYKQSVAKHGDNAKRIFTALVTRDKEIEIMRALVEAIPATRCLFGKPLTEEDRYHCRIIFLNCELEAFFGVGLGRKTRVFERGPFLADGSELIGGIEKFTETDFSTGVDDIYGCIDGIGSALDELANVDLDDEDEVEPIEEDLSLTVSHLNNYLDLDIHDLENDNH